MSFRVMNISVRGFHCPSENQVAIHISRRWRPSNLLILAYYALLRFQRLLDLDLLYPLPCSLNLALYRVQLRLLYGMLLLLLPRVNSLAVR